MLDVDRFIAVALPISPNPGGGGNPGGGRNARVLPTSIGVRIGDVVVSVFVDREDADTAEDGDDGASAKRLLFSVAFPLLRPVLFDSAFSFLGLSGIDDAFLFSRCRLVLETDEDPTPPASTGLTRGKALSRFFLL